MFGPIVRGVCFRCGLSKTPETLCPNVFVQLDPVLHPGYKVLIPFGLGDSCIFISYRVCSIKSCLRINFPEQFCRFSSVSRIKYFVESDDRINLYAPVIRGIERIVSKSPVLNTIIVCPTRVSPYARNILLYYVRTQLLVLV